MLRNGTLGSSTDKISQGNMPPDPLGACAFGSHFTVSQSTFFLDQCLLQFLLDTAQQVSNVSLVFQREEGTIALVQDKINALNTSLEALKTRPGEHLRSFDGSVGGRAFCYAAQNLWNNLPCKISSLDSLSSFKSHLKIYHFKQASNL